MTETRRQAGERTGHGRWLAAPAVCLVLLGGLVADRVMFHLPEGDPGPYHALVKAAIQAIPNTIGPWVGHEEPIPQAATELLRPNTILGRRYVNQKTGTSASLLIVHCTDARDIRGHYPPVCYPANGWKSARKLGHPRDWTVDGMKITGTEYDFYSGDFESNSSLVVESFILRPDGKIDRNMDGLSKAAYDPRRRPYGGGQVQLVFSGTVPEMERDEAFEMIIRACLPAIRTVLNGVKP